jgi:hypothetical protein
VIDNWTYLGDGVYATIDSIGQIVLITGTPEHQENIVFLDSMVLKAFLAYIKRLEIA